MMCLKYTNTIQNYFQEDIDDQMNEKITLTPCAVQIGKLYLYMYIVDNSY